MGSRIFKCNESNKWIFTEIVQLLELLDLKLKTNLHRFGFVYDTTKMKIKSLNQIIILELVTVLERKNIEI